MRASLRHAAEPAVAERRRSTAEGDGDEHQAEARWPAPGVGLEREVDASGMVWVRPGRLPAKVMVAPNSPRARAHASTAPAMQRRAHGGQRHPAEHVPATGAEGPRPPPPGGGRGRRRAASTVTTRNGMATNVSASTTPAVVKGRRIAEPVDERLADAGPAVRRREQRHAADDRREHHRQSAERRGRSRARGSPTRARTQARGTPSTIDTAVAESEQINDRRRAWSDDSSVSRLQASLQGTRARSPRKGRAKKATATTDRRITGHGGRSGTARRRPGRRPTGVDVGGVSVGVTAVRSRIRPGSAGRRPR